MNTTRSANVVYVLLAAAAAFAASAAVPWPWRAATFAAGIVLTGLGLVLAVKRAQHNRAGEPRS